ncbi:DNA polymerase IV [Leeia sp. TBRC 13508]|uniref:DNA polymerase IV n=1 Tax=Leeia speluncae TaxID=2884804 RepID=A0ABS8D6D8_9NEIS|nr:DNA polymerase IV [Leeia speluncae]MCB6183722.1 DNA polymerase IV [Leeia speluncae]
MIEPLRKIIHIDCDCFYASVEMRDEPTYRGIPLAVGGAADRRGVIATCNYEARKFGVRSAMSTYKAIQLCPHLKVVPPDFPRYREASLQIRAIFADYTDLIEPLSLDEAYLDVTGVDLCKGSATLMAKEIRQRIEQTVGITASAGIAPNKLLAKIASDWNKPNGQFLIRPEDVSDFITTLPAAKLWGVGKVTAEKLSKLGIETCLDMQGWSLAALVQNFGKFGQQLYDQCRGVDSRSVAPHERRKSLSVEYTFDQDLTTEESCLSKIPVLFEDWMKRMKKSASEQPHKAFVKIKYADFSQTTMECVCEQPDLHTFEGLLKQALPRKQQAVRLLGLGVRFHDKAPLPEGIQLPLWQDGDY